MDERLAKMFEPPPDEPDLVGRALKDAKKDIARLLAEVDRLRDGITRHRTRVFFGEDGVLNEYDLDLWALIEDDDA